MNDATQRLVPVREVNLLTPVGQLSYPALLEPGPVSREENAKLKYSTTLLIDKESIKEGTMQQLWQELTQTVLTYGVQEFGPKAVTASKPPKPTFNVHGIKDGDNVGQEYAENKWLIRASSGPDFKPKLFMPDDRELNPESDDINAIYPGANAALIVGLYYFPGGDAYKKGCSFTLQAVKITGGGDSLVGFGTTISSEEATNTFKQLGGILENDQQAALPAGESSNDDDIPGW